MANWSSATLLERLLELLAAESADNTSTQILDEPALLDADYPTGSSVIEFLKDRVIAEAMKGRAHVSRPTPKKRAAPKPKAPKVETTDEEPKRELKF